jgi:hypothetical protein
VGYSAAAATSNQTIGYLVDKYKQLNLFRAPQGNYCSATGADTTESW